MSKEPEPELCPHCHTNISTRELHLRAGELFIHLDCAVLRGIEAIVAEQGSTRESAPSPATKCRRGTLVRITARESAYFGRIGKVRYGPEDGLTSGAWIQVDLSRPGEIYFDEDYFEIEEEK